MIWKLYNYIVINDIYLFMCLKGISSNISSDSILTFIGYPHVVFAEVGQDLILKKRFRRQLTRPRRADRRQ